jgi:hypothetical protein
MKTKPKKRTLRKFHLDFYRAFLNEDSDKSAFIITQKKTAPIDTVLIDS